MALCSKCYLHHLSVLADSSTRFKEPSEAKDALEKMNGFELAGRAIRVGLGSDKFTNESTAAHMHRFDSRQPGLERQNGQGSAFSGSGGRGAPNGNARDKERGAGVASALDDADVSGVDFNNFSRASLMKRLAREDDNSAEAAQNKHKEALAKAQARQAQAMSNSANKPSPCIRVMNAFDPAE